MSKLRLQADDPDVLALTARALEASNRAAPPTVGRCSICRAIIARAGYTDAGPFFISSWKVPFASGHLVDGERVNQRRLDAIHDREATETKGQLTQDEHVSVIALLDLPIQLPADYPDLLVRCERDGDAVLDRHDVLDRLKRGDTEWKIAVGPPRREYEPPDSYSFTELTTVTRETQIRTVRWSGPTPCTE